MRNGIAIVSGGGHQGTIPKFGDSEENHEDLTP
jgi:hypothetical protein